MLKSIVYFLTFLIFFFLYTYEEPTSNYVDWVFPYRIYSQIFFLLFIAYSLLKKSSSLISMVFKKKFIPYLILIFIPFLFSFGLSAIDGSGLRSTILSLIIFCGAILFLKNNSYASFIYFFEQYSNVIFILVVFSFLRIFVDMSFLGLYFPKNDIGRISGWMYSPNYFSVFVGSAFLVVIHNFQSNKKKSLLLYIKILFFIAGILLSGSRGTLVTLLFVVLVSEFLSFVKGREIFFLKRYMWLIVVIIISFLITSNNFSNKVENVYDREGVDYLDDPRIAIWQYSLSKWSDLDLGSKIIGLGRGKSIIFSERSTHNSFLSILIDYGLIYFIFFICFNLYLLKKISSLSKIHYDFKLVLCIVLFLIFRSFTNNILSNHGFEQFLFDLCIVLSFTFNFHKKSFSTKNNM